MGLEPAGEAGEQCREEKHLHAQPADRNAETLGHHFVWQAADRTAAAAIENVGNAEKACADEQPDDNVDNARIGARPTEQHERRQPRNAIEAAEARQISEDEKEADPPGKGTEHKIMPGKPDGEEAED